MYHTDKQLVKNLQNISNYIIQNWMRSQNTIEYLGVWEQLNNPVFKSIEFDAFRNRAGLNNFSLHPKIPHRCS
nr:KilA-N domain-containing protein [Prevotella corporis]